MLRVYPKHARQAQKACRRFPSKPRILLSALLAASICGASQPMVAVTVDPETFETPNPGMSELQTAMIEIQTGKVKEAIARVQAILQKNEKNAEAQEVLGLAYGADGRADLAKQTLRKSIRLDPKRASTHTNLGIVQMALGAEGDAKGSFLTALRLNPDDARANQRIGLIYELEGDIGNAIAHLSAGTRKMPSDVLGVRYNLARLYLTLGNPEKTVEILGPFLGDDSPDPVLITTADAYLALQNKDNAETLYKRSAENTKTSAGLRGLAKIAVSNLDTDAALTLHNQAAETFPKDPQVFFDRGNLYALTKNYEQASADFEAGLALSPQNPAILRAASATELRLGNMGEAVRLAKEAAASPAADISDRFWLGVMEEQSGDKTAAAQTYSDIIKDAPDHWQSLNNLASILTDQGKPEEAVPLAKQALDIERENDAVLDTYGWALLQSGEAKAATSIFKKLHDEAPAPLTAYRLGLAYAALQNAAQARPLLETAARENGFKYADQAAKALADLTQ